MIEYYICLYYRSVQQKHISRTLPITPSAIWKKTRKLNKFLKLLTHRII